MDLTNSALQTYRDCKQLFGFVYVDRLRPHVEAPYFTWGRAFHAGAEAVLESQRFGRNEPVDERMARAVLVGERAIASALQGFRDRVRNAVEREQIAEDLAEDRIREADEKEPTLRWMLGHMVTATRSDFTARYPVAIEWPFSVPVPRAADGASGPNRARGRIDVVWYDAAEKDLIVEDYKTTSDRVTSNSRRIDMDPQTTGYLHAVRWMIDHDPAFQRSLRAGQIAFGVTPHKPRLGRVRFRTLRTKMPAEPRWLKNGTLSTDKSQDTLAEWYREALGRQEAPATHAQMDVLERLEARGDVWFAEAEAYRTQEDIDRWAREWRVDAAGARAVMRDPALRTRNLRVCTGIGGKCRYWTLCRDPENDLYRDEFRVADEMHEELAEDDTANNQLALGGG